MTSVYPLPQAKFEFKRFKHTIQKLPDMLPLSNEREGDERKMRAGQENK